MATDRERLCALLDDLGVFYLLGDPHVTITSDGWDGEKTHDAPKNHGYAGFAAVFEFNDDGEFQGVGIWE